MLVYKTLRNAISTHLLTVLTMSDITQSVDKIKSGYTT